MLGRAQEFDDLVDVLLQIDAHHFVLGNHDVIDGDILQIQNTQQHGFVPFRQNRAGFIHQRAQFLAAEVIRAPFPPHAPTARRTPLHTVFISPTSGYSSVISGFSAYTATNATFSGRRAASVLGVTSPTTSTASVSTALASAMLFSPHNRMAMMVAMAAAKIFTKLLAIRIMPIRRL